MTSVTTATSAAAYAPPVSAPGPILVAVGGRDPRGVLDFARDLASVTGREMIAMGVLEPYPQYAAGPEMVALPPSFDAERASRRLAALTAELRDVGATTAGWRAEVVHGAPAPTLAELACARHAAMIVMGIGSHRAVDRLLGGETALHVIRHAPCPVLAVGHAAAAPFHHAVIATDFGPAGAHAAECVLPLLAEGATISFVHAWQPADVEDARLANADRAYLAGLDERFRRLHDALRLPAGIEVKDVVREGRAAECVLDYAVAHHGDVVVAGRRTMRLLARLAVGSVTTALLRGAGCSVLVTPEPSLADADRFRRLLSGRSETDDPREWGVLLRAFTARNQGRRVALEVDDVALGAQVVETGYRLVNVAYDAVHHRVELEVGVADDAGRRVTRRIAGVESVTVDTAGSGRDTTLRVMHGPGQAILTFLTD